MKKLFALLGWLFLVFALTACEQTPSLSPEGIQTSQEDERWGEKFSLTFDEEWSVNVYEGEISSENFDAYTYRSFYGCKGLRCSNSTPSVWDEVKNILDENLSGQNYSLRQQALLKKTNDTDLILSQRGASFNFLTETEFTSQDDKIVIKNIEEQLPIVIRFDKPHRFMDGYVSARDVVVIDRYTLLPRFTEMEILSPQSLVEDSERLYAQSNAANTTNNQTIHYQKNSTIRLVLMRHLFCMV